MTTRPRLLHTALLLTATLALSACASRSLTRAPVEDRSSGTPRVTQAPKPVTPTRPPKGLENAGKPGFYTVQAGDNVFRIAKNNGRTVAEIARWNDLQDPYIIEIGDVLRVVPVGSESAAVVTRPVPAPGTTPKASSDPTAVAPKPPVAADSSVNWGWPASGPILQGFNPATNKGVDIAGKAGDPVLAAADGVVVYAGNALRGYGNMIILKHNNTFVTAYAHNQTLLVKDEQTVKRGQKIAEMGQTESDRVKLHFEIRKTSTPVDPMRYLPSR